MRAQKGEGGGGAKKREEGGRGRADGQGRRAQEGDCSDVCNGGNNDTCVDNVATFFLSTIMKPQSSSLVAPGAAATGSRRAGYAHVERCWLVSNLWTLFSR